MKYTWIVLALAGLDQGIKQNIQGFFFDFLVIFTIFGFPVPFKS